MRSGIRGWLGRWMCLAALGFPSTVLAEPGPSPEVPEEPSKVETPETPSSGPETTWWLGTAVGVAAGSGMPRAFLAGGAGVEWGVWWRFAPWYRLGLRNDFFVMQLPWSDREEPALVGASDDPDDPPGVVNCHEEGTTRLPRIRDHPRGPLSAVPRRGRWTGVARTPDP